MKNTEICGFIAKRDENKNSKGYEVSFSPRVKLNRDCQDSHKKDILSQDRSCGACGSEILSIDEAEVDLTIPNFKR